MGMGLPIKLHDCPFHTFYHGKICSADMLAYQLGSHFAIILGFPGCVNLPASLPGGCILEIQ